MMMKVLRSDFPLHVTVCPFHNPKYGKHEISINIDSLHIHNSESCVKYCSTVVTLRGLGACWHVSTAPKTYSLLGGHQASSSTTTNKNILLISASFVAVLVFGLLIRDSSHRQPPHKTNPKPNNESPKRRVYRKPTVSH